MKAVYAASLDPITNGHINVITRMAPLYDELVVVVAVDTRKSYTFSPEERVAMAKAAVAHLKNVTVDVCTGRYVVKYTVEIGAQVIIRGLRNSKDLEDELVLAGENRKICPQVETVWVPCLPDLMHVSSSMVKGHIGVDPGWEEQVARSVPAEVVSKLKEKYMLAKARKHWDALMRALGNPEGSLEVFADLVARYSEPHRGYHVLDHIVNMLDEFEPVSHLAEDPNAIRWAIWHHDAIYDPGSKDHPKIADNEERSAYLSRQNGGVLGLAEAFIVRGEELVLATAHVEFPSGPDAKLLVDLDLAILGKPEREFHTYELGVGKEYRWVPEETYRERRIKVLRFFLDRPAIYSTDFFRNKYEGAARKNLERSIARLKEEPYRFTS